MNRRRIVACVWVSLGLAAAPVFGQSTREPLNKAGDGVAQALRMRYAQAIRSAVRTNWLSPADLPKAACKVRIAQAPGGVVEDVKVEPDCPYDEAGRRSVIAAVRRAEPLPYKGFESVFQRTLIFTFMPGLEDEAGHATH